MKKWEMVLRRMIFDGSRYLLVNESRFEKLEW